MPAVAVAVAASWAGSVVAGALTTSFAGFFFVKAGVAFAISAIGGSLFEDDEPSMSKEASGRLQTVRSAIQPRRIVYGECMVAGTLVAAATSERAGSVAPAAVAFVLAIDALAGDTRIVVKGWDSRGPHGLAAGDTFTLAGQSLVLAADPVAYERLDSEMSQLTDWLVLDLTTALTADRAAETATSLSWQPPAEDDGKENEYLHMVLALAGHEVEDIGAIYFNELPATDARFTRDGEPYYHVEKFFGPPDQTACATLMTAFPAAWTADHRLRGTAYIYVRLRWHPDVWPGGIPNVKAIVKGKKVYDPRAETTAWSNNWALCMRDYLASAYGLACAADEIDDASVIAAANTCDEQVALDAGGTATQARYTCDGSFTTDQTPRAVLESLCTAAAGAVVWSQGQWRLHAGHYATPTVSLTEDDLRGPIKLRPRQSRRDLYNAVRGVCANPANQWQNGDFPVVTNATYAAQDSEQIWRDIELPFTTDATRAQRIAKIHLEKSRQAISVEFPAKLSALRLSCMDTVKLSIARLGWTDKVFSVLSWSLAADGGVDLVLQEEASGVYDWNYGMATAADFAPDTALASPFVVAPPTDLALTETIYRAGASWQSKLAVYWRAAPDARLRHYVLAWRKSGDAAWQEHITTATRLEVAVVQPGSYEARLKAVNHYDASSAWTATQTVVVAGAQGVVTAIGLPAIVNPGVRVRSDRAGHVDRIQLTAGWAAGNVEPDGIALYYSVTDYANKVTIASGGTSSTLTIAGAEVLNQGTLTALAGSTASQLVVTTATQPMPDFTDVYGMVWMQFGASQWRKARESDATTVYFGQDFDISPTPGATINWVELAWVDNRADEFRLGYLADAAGNYEIVQWAGVQQVGGSFQLVGCQRGEEGTAPINADGKDFHYFPAPGAGSVQLLLPAASFVRDGATLRASIDVDIAIKSGQVGSISACVYTAAAGGFVRSALVPVDLLGELT